MAIVLFICVLGQPLVLAHLDGFTAVHPLVTSSVHVWITEPPVRCVLYIHFFPYNVTDARTGCALSVRGHTVSRAGNAELREKNSAHPHV